MARPPRVPRPTPRQSGRAPKGETQIIARLDPLTLAALEGAKYIQEAKGEPDMGSKAQRLAELAADLELALIVHGPSDLSGRLCIDIAALALRILDDAELPPPPVMGDAP